MLRLLIARILFGGLALAVSAQAAVVRGANSDDERAPAAAKNSASASPKTAGNAGASPAKIGGGQKHPGATGETLLRSDALLRLVEGSHVRITAGALDQLVRKTIDESVPVTDLLLGTPVSGRARLQGCSSLKLAADPTRAVFDIFLVGSADSQTVGDAGRAHIHSRTVTRFAARKRVILDEHGLTALPATCNATAASTLLGTTSPLPGVRGRLAGRIGRRRAQQQLAQADRISARHSAEEICRRFDAEVAAQLAEANRLLARQTAEWARRPGGRLPLRFSTTAEHLCASGVKAEPALAEAQPSTRGSPKSLAAVIVIPAAAVDLPTLAGLIGGLARDSQAYSVSALAQQVLPADVAQLLDESDSKRDADYGVRFSVDRGRLVLAVHARDDY